MTHSTHFINGYISILLLFLNPTQWFINLTANNLILTARQSVAFNTGLTTPRSEVSSNYIEYICLLSGEQGNCIDIVYALNSVFNHY